jgi:tetratricopeptide (TPR) repeat protein
MEPAAFCPVCQQPMVGGICRPCAFATALAGVSPGALAGAPVADGGSIAPEGYELLHELGAGATAVVWLARERKLDRLVALKLIAATADRRLTQRLVREGQAAARLRHPHIVAVHALDATEGRAYLAMDFLEGGDLRQRLARGLLAPRATAELVHKLAGALAHAHAGGVLHRDIKPSNVLLDAEGEPHLADFGLAAPLLGGGDITLPGQVAGTAAYLAPELLAGADRASPLSDLYGLGAVLYECLAGRPPFIGDSSAAIFAQLAGEEPPAPRLLRPGVPRDLETICLKCLEKTPARRYGSATALQEDLGRYLHGEPIAARPVGFIGKTARWCRRRPGTALAAGTAAVLLPLLAVGGPLVAVRLARARAQADAEAAASKAVSDFLQNDLLAQAAPEQQPDRNLALRTVLDRAAKKIAGRFPQQPLVEADIHDTIANTYFPLGEFEAAREHWQRTVELRRSELGPDHPKTLRAAANLFTALRTLGRVAEADALGTDILARQRRMLAPTDPDLVETMNDLAMLRRTQGRYAEAESLYKEAILIRRTTLGPDRPETITLVGNLGVLYRFEGKLEQAEALLTDTLARRRRVLGPEHPDTLSSRHFLAMLQADRGHYAEAGRSAAEVVALRTRVLGADHPETLSSKNVLALALRDTGKTAEAETLGAEILTAHHRQLGADHPGTLLLTNNLASIYHQQGKLAEAEALLHDALARERRALGPQHSTTLAALALLARVYLDEGRLDEAGATAVEARELTERGFGAAHPRVARALELQGRLLLRQARHEEAERVLRESLVRRKLPVAESWETAAVQSCLGETLTGLARYQEAEPLLLGARDALLKSRETIPAGSRGEITDATDRLVRLYTAWGKPEQAEVWRARVSEGK